MPFVINGVGTWQYGKRNVHRLRGVCSQCGIMADLESYDTTLYFVVVYVPMIPLVRRRVLEACPGCSRFRVMPLRQWERAKAEAVEGAVERLRADPDDREAILNAIGVAATFQDEPLFDKLSDALAAHRTGDAQLQAALGDANGYFARHDQAAVAYRHSLAAEDNPPVREQLGLTLLRLGDPAEAAGCFRHLLDPAAGDRLWLLYQLTVAYQAKGMHAEALELLDKVNETFPATAGVKDWQKLRKASERDRGRGRPVGKSALVEGRGAGTREGSRFGAVLPLLALPLLALGFAGWHTWRSLSLADARPMYLVNGSPKAYTVTVNGTPHQLAPGSAKPVELPEGEITLAPGPGADGIEPATVRVGSSFWARPYDGTRVVLNPDRLAVLVRETSVYAQNPPPNPPDQYFTNRAVHEFTGINHAFEPFPPTVRMKAGQTVTRTRLGVVPVGKPEERVSAVAVAGLPPAELAEYAGRWLAVAPDDPIALAWFAGAVPPEAALAVLKAKLGDRPLRVEWHRAYQTVAERAGHPADGLRRDYRKLADDLGRDPDALYLFARVADRAESLAALREAVGSGKPADRAHYAIGYRLLSEGDFKAAAAEMDKAGAMATTPAYRAPFREALLAAGRYRDLLARLDADGHDLLTLVEKARVCEIAGDSAGADAAAAAALGRVPSQAGGQLRGLILATITAGRAAAKGDVAGYLAATDGMGGGSAVDALLRGEPASAEPAGNGAPHGGGAAVTPGLLLLAKPSDPAAKKRFLDALAAGEREERRLKEVLDRGGPDGLTAVRELVIPPQDKRVYAAVAAIWFPGQKAELLAFARKMDFQRDAISLALRKVIRP